MAAGYFCNRAGFLAWLFIVGGMLGTDVIDGPLARVLKAETKFGEKADMFCDVVANWILVIGWYIYTQRHFEFAQEWFNPGRLILDFLTVALTIGLIFSINTTASLKFWSVVIKWFAEDMGNFFFGTTVAGLIILWLAYNVNLLLVYVTVFSGLVAILVNAEKVTDFAKSAFPVFWKN